MPESSATQIELHLVIPGLCGPLADIRLLEQDNQLKSWLNTLAKATIRPATKPTTQAVTKPATKATSSISKPNDNAYSAIAGITGLKIEADFPSAVLTALALGNKIYDESLFYMHADPVHLRADMDHAVLTSSDDLAINKESSEQLINALNDHFEQDGLHYIAIDESHWLISSKNKIDLSTTSLLDAIGRNVNFILPQGADKRYWRQSLNEAQMLMFSNEVNQQREHKGLQSINSVWFHGSGELPAYPPNENGFERNNNDYRFCGNSLVLKGLAAHLSKQLNSEFQPQPDTVEEYKNILRHQAEASNIVNVLYIDRLENLVNYSDVQPWLNQMHDLLENWIYPLISFSNKNNIIFHLHPCNAKQYQFSKYDALKFWRYKPNKKLHQFIESYSAD